MEVKKLLTDDINESEEKIKKNLNNLKNDEIIEGIIHLSDASKFGGNSVGCIEVLATELKERKMKCCICNKSIWAGFFIEDKYYCTTCGIKERIIDITFQKR